MNHPGYGFERGIFLNNDGYNRAFKRLMGKLFPPSYPNDFASRQRGEVYILMALLTSFVCLTLTLYSATQGLFEKNLPIFLIGTVTFLALLLFKRGIISIRFAQSLLIGVAAAGMMGDIYQTGGLFGGEVYWLATLPIFGVLMLNYKTGIWWMLAAILGVAIVLSWHALEWMEPEPPLEVMERNAISVVMLIVVCTAGLIFIEYGYQQALLRERATHQRQEHLEQRLLQSQKRESLGVLAGGVAHDFNNLLVGINSELELALASQGDPRSVEASIEAALRAGQKAADLTHLLLTYSGKRPISQKPHGLSHLVESTIALARSTLPRSIHVTFSDDTDGHAMVLGDATQLEQVLLNFLFNAADASHNQGSIDVRVGRHTLSDQEQSHNATGAALEPGEYLFVEIQDHGHGMDPETLTRIFEPFFTTKFTGRGLGLAAALGIAKAHHGGLFVESVVGQGTRFRLLLKPHQDALDAHPPPTPTLATSPTIGAGMTVLIIDDEPLVRHVLRRLLERMGCTVLEAEGGQQGLEMFATKRPALKGVWLDLTMPDTPGDQVLRELRAAEESFPVVLVSGYSAEDVSALLHGDPYTRFLSKPFQLAGVREMVEWQFSAAPPSGERRAAPHRAT